MQNILLDSKKVFTTKSPFKIKIKEKVKKEPKFPIGAEQYDIGGYRVRKIADTGSAHDWQYVHHLLWLEAGREIPEGYTIAFRDERRCNITLENLEIVSKKEFLRRDAMQRNRIQAFVNSSKTFTRGKYLVLYIPKKKNPPYLHREIWKLAGREIPPKHVLYFIDGNPNNVCLENLGLLTSSEFGRRSSIERNKNPGYGFKEGNQTWTSVKRKPLGSEYLTKDGYLRRKVKETGTYNEMYPLVHHLVWLKAGREIPPGHFLCFKDGNRQNIALENLELLTNSELSRNTLIRRNKSRPNAKKMPIGAERVNGYGYLCRKVKETGIFKEDWKLVHHLIWLEAGREIPPGCRLCFKDGDRTNINLENLELLTISENFKKWSRILPIGFRVMVRDVKKLGKVIEHMKDQEQGEV